MIDCQCQKDSDTDVIPIDRKISTKHLWLIVVIFVFIILNYRSSQATHLFCYASKVTQSFSVWASATAGDYTSNVNLMFDKLER